MDTPEKHQQASLSFVKEEDVELEVEPGFQEQQRQPNGRQTTESASAHVKGGGRIGHVEWSAEQRQKLRPEGLSSLDEMWEGSTDQDTKKAEAMEI